MKKSSPRYWRSYINANNIYDTRGRGGGGCGLLERFQANTIEVDGFDFLSSNSWPPMALTTTNTATNTAPSFLTHSPPHLSTSAQQMLLLEQLEQLRHLAELAASESPPNSALTNPQLTTQHLLSEQQHQSQMQQQQLLLQQQLLQPQLPTQLMVTDNSGELIEQFFVDAIDPSLQSITDHSSSVLINIPPTVVNSNNCATQNTFTMQPQPTHTHLSTSHPSLNVHTPAIPTHYNTTSMHYPKIFSHTIDITGSGSGPTTNYGSGYADVVGSSINNNNYTFLNVPDIDEYKHINSHYFQQHRGTIFNTNSAGIEPHAHSVSSSPSSYVGYVRDHYDKSCSHCQNGSQPVVLSTNAALTTTPGLAISPCNDPYCVIDAHPHPQHEPITYPYTAEQLLRRPSLSMFQPISEPSLTTSNMAMCNECVDQHFIDGRTGPQIDLGAVPTYHVHTPTPTAHKMAKSILPQLPQLPTQSVLRLSRQLSEDALINAVPIAESKIQPPSILKKPRIRMKNTDLCVDRRKYFREGQSRSLDYDDLHAKSWGRRRIRYEDECYDYYPAELDVEDLSRNYGSETNIRRFGVNYYERELPPSTHYYRDMRSRGLDGRERNHMSLDLPSTKPYSMKRRRNLPHIPNTQNDQNPPHTAFPNSSGTVERPGPIGGHTDPNRLSAPKSRQSVLSASSSRYRSYDLDRNSSNQSKYYEYDSSEYDNTNYSGSVRQKERRGEVSYTTAEQELQQTNKQMSGGSGATGYATSTTDTATGNVNVGSNIANNASSSSFANSHHGVANSSSPNKRASLKHTNTINDANDNVTADGITTTTTSTTTSIQTTNSTTITTTKS